MCSVSFVPIHSSFILTSSRDEKNYRPTDYPQVIEEDGLKLLYPKDKNAGGTWIVAKENGTCIVLLNGGFTNHIKRDNYAKSRGVILKDIIKKEDPLAYFKTIDLTNIEPFTLIILHKNTLTEVKWDGEDKHCIPKATKEAHFWSSATLYNREQQAIRNSWFHEFYSALKVKTAEAILNFHKTAYAENTTYGLVIKRPDKTETVSITQVAITGSGAITMSYTDRIKNMCTEAITF